VVEEESEGESLEEEDGFFVGEDGVGDTEELEAEAFFFFFLLLLDMLRS
jgi:hypothetical protein